MKKILIFLSVVVLALAVYFGWIWKPHTKPVVINHQVKPVAQITPVAATVAVDPRKAALEAFFAHYDCSAELPAELYLSKASEYGLDWRLLPAISLKESSCGAHFINNNYYGWESGAKKFDTLEEGLDFVASHIGTMQPYLKAGGDSEKILRIYNNHLGYAESVLKIMDSISK